LSIAQQLILASSVLIAVTVAVITLVSLRRIDEQAREQIQRHEEIGKRAFQRESVLISKALAQSIAYMLAVNAWNEITDVLEAGVAEHGLGAEPAQAPRSARPAVEWFLAFEGDSPLVANVPKWSSRMAPREDAELTRIAEELGPRQAGDGERADEPRCSKHASGKLEVSWLCEAPIMRLGGRLGSVWTRVSAQGLIDEVNGIRRTYQARMVRYRNNVLVIAAGILGLGVLLAIGLGLRMTRPVRHLTEQAKRLGSGDLAGRVPTGQMGELGVLAERFNEMADEIGVLMAEQAKKATLEHEMSLARSVQQAMLPPHSLERFAALKVTGYCAPASSCGGDWWMWHKLSQDRMLIVLGDATGHGIHSAMIASTARGAVEALAALGEELLTPEQVLRAIDSAIRNVGEHHVLMTAFAALFDARSGELAYANAGQNFPYVVRRDAGDVLGEAAILATGSNPLGDREIPLQIRCGARRLAPGDVFVCFTDGLVERANPAGAQFGDRRLLRALRNQPVGGEQALLILRERVVAAMEEHAAGGVASDDVTLVMCQYDPPAVAARSPSAEMG
jgi:serine phosphatase RsbU (regulator of sigma subunit)